MTTAEQVVTPRVTRWSLGRLLAWVVIVYTALRAFTTVLLWWMATSEQDPSVYGEEHPFFEFAVLWDGQWYQEIATEGYPEELPTNDAGEVRQNPWAFYPLFPFLARGLMALTGAPFPVAGVIVATVIGYLAATALAVLLRDRVGDAVALGAVALFAAFPAAPTLQVAYTESLAVLLLCLVLYFLGKEQWLAAAAVALLTGIARPIAIPLGVVALVMVIVRWRRRHTDPLGAGEKVRMLLALGACGLSGLLWPAIAWWRTGRSDAYTATMSAWRGNEDIVPFEPAFWVSGHLFGSLGPWLLVGSLLLLAVAVLGPWAAAMGPDLRAWTLAYPLYLTAMTNPWTSTYRYLLPVLGLYVLLIGGGWRSGQWVRGRSGERTGDQPPWLLVVRIVAFTGLFLGWQVWWTWELFQFVPPSDYPP